MSQVTITVSYSASESFDSTYPTNVVVTSEGLCTYIPPGMFKSSCPIDITWFPFDDQSCEMKFGSWTYNGFKVNFMLQQDTGDISGFIPNGEWALLGESLLRVLVDLQLSAFPVLFTFLHCIVLYLMKDL